MRIYPADVSSPFGCPKGLAYSGFCILCIMMEPITLFWFLSLRNFIGSKMIFPSFASASRTPSYTKYFRILQNWNQT